MSAVKNDTEHVVRAVCDALRDVITALAPHMKEMKVDEDTAFVRMLLNEYADSLANGTEHDDELWLDVSSGLQTMIDKKLAASAERRRAATERVDAIAAALREQGFDVESVPNTWGDPYALDISRDGEVIKKHERVASFLPEEAQALVRAGGDVEKYREQAAREWDREHPVITVRSDMSPRTIKARVNRLRTQSFNSFDGDRAADWLLANLDVWEGFQFYFDTLDLKPRDGQEKEIVTIGSQLHADEVFWNTWQDESTAPFRGEFVTLWWD